MNFQYFFENSVVTNQGVYRLDEGIDHIEALPQDQFIDTIENLSNFIATEKLDGANLVFGFDEKGKLYTSREAKGAAEKIYSPSDYDNKPANNGFRSAHAALEEVKDELQTVLDKGEAVELEILFGRQPNAIVYGTSHIAFLRMLPGDNKEEPDQNKIKQLEQALKGKVVSVKTKHVYTETGVELDTKEVKHDWKFASTAYIDSNHFEKVDVQDELEQFKKFLNKKNETGGMDLTNGQIMSVNLRSVPKDVREEVKQERERVINKAYKEYKLPIKQKLVDNILRQMKPKLRDVEVDPHEDVGVEGVVLLNPQTLEQVKIVDKDLFTTINQFNFAIRNEIKATSKGNQQLPATLGRQGNDIFGDMLKEIASVTGIDGFGTYTRIKTTLKKYKGEDIEQTIKNVVSDFKTQDVQKAKTQITNAIQQAVQELDQALDKYKNKWDQYQMELPTGKKIKYTEEIHQRTLTVFAEVRQEMNSMKQGVTKADTLGDILVALFGERLKSIH